MAIDATDTGGVERASRVSGGSEAGGLDKSDEKEVQGAADGRTGDIQGAALRAAGGNMTQDGFTQNPGGSVQTAQAVMPLIAPRIGPMVRPGMGLENIPVRPSGPLVSPMSEPKSDKWTEKGFHKEKQDGGVTPGPEDERNPDLKGRERRDAVEDGRDTGNKLRREHDIRQQRQQRQRDKNFFDKLRDWFAPSPTISDQDLIA